MTYFIYKWNASDTTTELSNELGKTKGLKTFLRNFLIIESCPHFNLKKDFFIKIEYERGPFSTKNNMLFLGCDECKIRKENTRCDNVYKRGFLYEYGCNFIDIILKSRLLKMGINYEVGIDDKIQIQTPFASKFLSILSSPYGYPYYIRNENILIITNIFRFSIDLVKYLKPDILVLFEDKSNLYKYLNINTNILFYEKNQLSYYDKNKHVEENVQKIIEKIVTDMENYIEKIRGNEHDRIVSALFSIGQDLNYIPQREYTKSGVRLDCIWIDRNGDIQVAAEVETSSTWKKDLISTWEVEPKLAIIVGFSKTDGVVKNLMKLSLMKYIPHFVFYINKQTYHAFLLDKHEIVKYYDLKEEKGFKGENIQII